MKRRRFAAVIAGLITLSAITSSLVSCTSSFDYYDPTKVASSEDETKSGATAAVTIFIPVTETEKQTERESETEKQTETETQTETEEKIETETEEVIEIDTVEDADLFIRKVLSDAYIDSYCYDADNEDAEYSSFSSFTVKEAYKPRYSVDPDVYLLNSGTIWIDSDTDLRLGMKIDDLEYQGWTFNYSDPDSQTIPPFSEVSGSFARDTAGIGVDIYNNGEGTIGYRDGQIVRVSFKQYEANYGQKKYRKLDSAVQFVLDNKVTDDSTLTDVLRAFGAPDSIGYFIDPDFKELSTVKVCYLDLGAGLGDSSWASEYIDFIFSWDGSFIISLDVSG